MIPRLVLLTMQVKLYSIRTELITLEVSLNVQCMWESSVGECHRDLAHPTRIMQHTYGALYSLANLNVQSGRVP